MNYPADFVARVKKAFPDNRTLHKALDNNQDQAGLFLGSPRNYDVAPATVLELLKKKEYGKLKRRMEHQRRCARLAQEWIQLNGGKAYGS